MNLGLSFSDFVVFVKEIFKSGDISNYILFSIVLVFAPDLIKLIRDVHWKAKKYHIRDGHSYWGGIGSGFKWKFYDFIGYDPFRDWFRK
ncbi:hypothetical protein [Desulforamulus aeronauticus]|uniref:hypothetical protein n=1 Tax=Desulforamulus aeronauticus TaxID=53343 RepID=UPI0009337002|nr:hypothetical protein [Desulforamulus aeronauticus]